MIKILKILEVKKPFKPEGKSYTVYSVVCGVEHEGKKIKCEVKAFAENTFNMIKEGAEVNAEKNVYQGKTSFVIKAVKKPFSKNGYRPSYTLQEFEAVIDRAMTCANKNTDLTKEINIPMLISIFERYVNNALMYGIKVPIEDKKEIVKNAVNGSEVEFPDFSDLDEKEDNDFYEDENG